MALTAKPLTRAICRFHDVILRTAVRASPDHLGATADRLVAAKDPKAIFEFVRDQIITYPPTGVDGAVKETRWGVRGTLRSAVVRARRAKKPSSW